MQNKQRIIDGLDESSDEMTKKVAYALSEDEAIILNKRFEKDISCQKGATPITTIFELRRHENIISYKLSFRVFLGSSMQVNLI